MQGVKDASGLQGIGEYDFIPLTRPAQALDL
jgi:hypothetical protein